ncbi:20332_t:CDS:1, partial [Entrophospora sp. SA101]
NVDQFLSAAADEVGIERTLTATFVNSDATAPKSSFHQVNKFTLL